MEDYIIWIVIGVVFCQGIILLLNRKKSDRDNWRMESIDKYKDSLELDRLIARKILELRELKNDIWKWNHISYINVNIWIHSRIYDCVYNL